LIKLKKGVPGVVALLLKYWNPPPYYHLHDTLLCYLGHLCIPSSKCENLIWEAHYSQVVGHFVLEKTVAVLQNYFYWKKIDRMWENISYLTLLVPLRSKACELLFLVLAIHGNPSPWTICMDFLLPTMVKTMYLWSLIDLRWKYILHEEHHNIIY